MHIPRIFDPLRPRREAAIRAALLRTVEHFYAVQGPLAAGKTLAQFAIRANDEHCGVIVQHAAQILRAEGWGCVRMHGLGWHFVLLDTRSRRLYDVETPMGVAATRDGVASLTQGRRMREIARCDDPADVEAIRAWYAAACQERWKCASDGDGVPLA